MMRRALDVGALLAAWHATGGRLMFATFTMRHRKGQRLVDLWNGVQRGWARVTQGKSWIRDQRAGEICGWVRVVEVTHGRNGWHVHVHAVFLVGAKTTVDRVDSLHAAMFDRWRAGVVAAGFAAPLAIGQDARLITDAHVAELGAYFAKAVDLPGVGGGQGAQGGPEGSPAHLDGAGPGRSLALELTQSQTKAARSAHGTLPPWRLLDAVLEDGDADALDLWREWEEGSSGRRQITYSVGIRQALGLAAAKTDDEVAAEVPGDDDLVLITSAGWSQLVRQPHLIAQLIDAADEGGLPSARRFLDRFRIEYQEV